MTTRFAPWLILPVLLLGMVPALPAQDSTAFQPTYHLGAWGGPSWHTVNFAPEVAQTNLQAVRFGAAFRYRSTPNLGVSVEVGYDRRGWAETADSSAANYTREIEYLELGFFTNIAMGKGRFQPLLLLGPYISYPLGATETFPPGWDTQGRPYYQDPIPNRLQYGIHGGLGLSLHLGALVLQLDGRYRYGFNGIFPAGDYSLTFSQSQSITAQASLFFQI